VRFIIVYFCVFILETTPPRLSLPVANGNVLTRKVIKMQGWKGQWDAFLRFHFLKKE
jgi:hypothetical protein